MNNNIVNGSARQEIKWIHLLRVVACMMVVSLHSLPPADEFVLTDAEVNFKNIIILLTKPCVPLFFMITGFLILPYKESDFMLFYKKRLPRVLFPLLSWGVIYAILPYWLGMCDEKIMIIELFLSPIKTPELIGGILWYIFILIGIYLFIPFLTKEIYTDKRIVSMYLLLWLIASILYIFHKKVPDLLGENQYENNFNLLIYFWGYFGYVLMGYSIKKWGCIENFFTTRTTGGKKYYLLIYLLLIIISVLIPSLASQFPRIGVVIMSYSLFMLIKDVDVTIGGNFFYNIVRTISKYSFGIFLCHMLVFRIFSINIYRYFGTVWYWQFTVMLITFVVGYFISRLISMLPKASYITG